jgi:hypothetical protein
LDRKNPVTTNVRVLVSACSEMDVLIRVPRMLVVKKSAKATDKTMTAAVPVTVGPIARTECLPSTSPSATSEMTNKSVAWLMEPMRERRMKMAIFRRSAPRPSIRKTERSESVGASVWLDGTESRELVRASPLLDGPCRALDEGLFTGPVSAAGYAPVRRGAERTCAEIVVCAAS